jgi:hypothetical protein
MHTCLMVETGMCDDHVCVAVTTFCRSAACGPRASLDVLQQCCCCIPPRCRLRLYDPQGNGVAASSVHVSHSGHTAEALDPGRLIGCKINTNSSAQVRNSHHGISSQMQGAHTQRLIREVSGLRMGHALATVAVRADL